MSGPGRPSEPLDPSGGALPALAYELRALRHRSGLTLRAVAEATNYSLATCTAASRGRQLPTWDVTAAFARACGGDEKRVRRLWEEAARSLGREIAPETPVGDPPDPSTAGTAQEFVKRLAELRAWARLPLRELNQRAGGHNALPPSTVSETLKRGRLPDAAFVRAFVTACGLGADRVQVWLDVRDGLSQADDEPVPVVPAPSPPPDPNRFARWLRALVGVREEILDHAPHERGRYNRRGLLVLVSPLVAGVSFYLAAADLFESVVAVAASVVWTYLVLNVDSWLVASLRGRRGGGRVVLLRVVMAMLVGVIVAEPLTLKIFEGQIEQRIRDDRQHAFVQAQNALRRCNPVPAADVPEGCASYRLVLPPGADQDRALLAMRTAELTALSARVDTNRRRYADLRRLAEAECVGQRGRGLSGQAGLGPACKARRTAADDFYRSSELEKDQQALVTMTTQVAQLKKAVRASMEHFIGERVSVLRAQILDAPVGLLARTEALGTLSGESPLVLATSWLVRLLLVSVPIAPVLLTWLEGQTLYNRLLLEDEHRRGLRLQEQRAAEAAQELGELHALADTIRDLLHRLPDPERQPDLFLDITALLAILTEVRTRLDRLAGPPPETP